MINCKNCNSINPDGALKCINCNAPLDGSMVRQPEGKTGVSSGSVTCKNCKSINPATALKCNNCNAPLDGSMVMEQDSSVSSGQVMCKNCKTLNQSEALKCKNCNAPLEGSMVIMNKPQKSSKKIDKSTSVMSVKADRKNNVCPNCAYPNQASATVCVKCNSELPNQESRKSVSHQKDIENNQLTSPKSSMNMTVNPWADLPKEDKFILIPLDSNQNPEQSFIGLSGESNKLNRDNLDPGNNAITSHIQAVIEKKDGKWTISNKSAMNTTFVQVSNEVELKEGDVILMGNRMFKFTRKS